MGKTGVLFDLDGTLMDSLGDLHAAVNYIMEQYGCPARTQEEICRFIGNGARRLIELSLPGGENDPPVDRVLADYQVYYKDLCTRGGTKPYAGIPEAVAWLQQKYPVAVVSNKPDLATKDLAKKFFPGMYALGVTEDCPRKPAPDMLYKAMDQMGVDRCVYVGDSEVDILTAANAGMPCLSVSWGFRKKQELVDAGAKYLCDDTGKMARAIEEIIQTELA